MIALLFAYEKEWFPILICIFIMKVRTLPLGQVLEMNKLESLAAFHAILFLHSESNSNFIYLGVYISVTSINFYSLVLFNI